MSKSHEQPVMNPAVENKVRHRVRKVDFDEMCVQPERRCVEAQCNKAGPYELPTYQLQGGR